MMLLSIVAGLIGAAALALWAWCLGDERGRRIGAHSGYQCGVIDGRRMGRREREREIMEAALSDECPQ